MNYRIKQARILSGKTLRDSAKDLGFSFQYLHKIEKNGFNADSTLLLKFAKHYNVTVDYLIPRKKEIVFGDIEFHSYNF